MILPLEQQVAPLALCQRLKELGAPQATAFAWFGSELRSVRWTHMTRADGSRYWERDPDDPRDVPHCAAYTVAELGAMLPGDANILGSRGSMRKAHLVIEKEGRPIFDDGWNCAYQEWNNDDCEQHLLDANAHTEAEARALLLIALIERGVVTFEKERAR